MRSLLLTLVIWSVLLTGASAGEYHTLNRDWASKYLKSVLVYGSHHYQPSEGVVSDEQTAVSIAVAVWNPIYGEDNIAKQKPYQVFLVDGYWVVSGSLPKRMVGGTAKIVIAREDGRIINISHGK